MPHRRSTSRSVVRPLALVLTLSAGLTLSACGGEDALTEAIRGASRSLNSLSAGGGGFPEEGAARRKALADIQAKVRGVSEDGASPAQQAGLALVNARVAQALGDLDAQQAADLEGQSLAKVAEMRALVRRYVTQSASAASNEQFNPSEAIEKARGEIAKRREAMTAAQNTQAALAREVDDLRQKSEALARQASAKRDEAAGVRSAAQGQSQAAQLSAVEQAAAISREASRLDTQASLLAADVSARTPVLEEQKQQIEATAEEVRRLEARVKELETRQALAKQLASESAAGAREAAGAISATLAEVEALRSGDLEKATSSALSSYQASTAAARKSPVGLKGDDAGALKLAAGIAQQGEGDLLLIKSRGLASLAGVLSSAAEATPAMPDQSALASAASRYQEQATAALTAAQDALQRASEAYGSVSGMKGPMVKERAEYTAATLTWIKAGDMSAPRPVMGGSPAGGGESGAGGSAGSGGSAPVAGDSPEQAAIRGTIARAMDAAKAGDIAAATAIINPTSDAQKDALAKFAALGTAMKRLDAACTAKLGASFREIAANSPMGPALSRMGGMKSNENPADLKIEVKSPSEAVVTGPDGEARTLRLVDGQWKTDMPAEMMQGMDQMLPMLGAFAQVMDSLAGDVESGAITSREQLLGAMMQKMQQLAPGGGGGG